MGLDEVVRRGSQALPPQDTLRPFGQVKETWKEDARPFIAASYVELELGNLSIAVARVNWVHHEVSDAF